MTTRDRQLVAIAAAHLDGDHDRVHTLARDHLADHPDHLLVAWIAATAHRGEIMNRKLTAVLLITAAVLTNVAFTVLGSVFNYPDILKEPVDEILTAFRASQAAVTGWFAVMAAVRRLVRPDRHRGRPALRPTARCASPCRSGIAAAVVQVIGLSRWPLLVPGYAADATSSDPAVAAAARDAFETAHHMLGNLIGETFGYAVHRRLDAARAAPRWAGPIAGRWFTALGAAPRCSSLAGVLSPLDLPMLDTANFVGYVLWSVWLVAFAVLLLRRPGRDRRHRRRRRDCTVSTGDVVAVCSAVRGCSGPPDSCPSRSPASPALLSAAGSTARWPP